MLDQPDVLAKPELLKLRRNSYKTDLRYETFVRKVIHIPQIQLLTSNKEGQ
jgi:hypothetical protein